MLHLVRVTSRKQYLDKKLSLLAKDEHSFLSFNKS